MPVDSSVQIDTLLEDTSPDATKIGMLATAELADAVRVPAWTHHTVLDPVMVATGTAFDEQAVGAVRRLCAKADLITNLCETAVLLGEAATRAAQPGVAPEDLRTWVLVAASPER